MKINIVSIEEPVYIYRFWEKVLGALHTQVERVYIYRQRPRGLRRSIYEALYNMLLVIYLYRLKDIIRLMKDYLLAALKGKRVSCSLSCLAERYGIPASITDSVNSNEFREALRSGQPDLVLAQIPVFVRKETLDIPSRGWINKHFGLLPDYKGAFPFLWARWNSERLMGVTVHFMNEKYDEGDMLGQRTEEVGRNECLSSILGRLNESAAELMVECVDNNHKRHIQTAKSGRIFKKPTIRQLLGHIISESIPFGGRLKCV